MYSLQNNNNNNNNSNSNYIAPHADLQSHYCQMFKSLLKQKKDSPALIIL